MNVNFNLTVTVHFPQPLTVVIKDDAADTEAAAKLASAREQLAKATSETKLPPENTATASN